MCCYRPGPHTLYLLVFRDDLLHSQAQTRKPNQRWNNGGKGSRRNVGGIKSRKRSLAPGERIRSVARLEAFEDPQFSEFCQKYQVTEENAKKALINLLHVLGQLGSLILEGPCGCLEVNLMVCYTLRERTRNPPVTDLPGTMPGIFLRVAGEVNPYVALKALSGSGDSLVEKIRSIARLKTFELPEIDLFCQQYQITDKQALRNLLQRLKGTDLILEDPDFDKPWDVIKLERSKFS